MGQADIKLNVTSNFDGSGLTSARGALDHFRTSVGNAEGAGGKLSAGWRAATDTVKANAGLMAVAAGAAIVGFATNAISAFTDTAKAAIDMGLATGLTVDEASRWIAVADDYEISAGTLTTGLGKISKTIDDTKWAKYGIETRDASGEARSANDILLDTFDMLGKVENGTEQARIGNALFGKGYQNLAPMIGKTRSEYEGMLGAVEEGQVITSKEAKTAEAMRLAQDKLSDALKEFTLAAGAALSGLAPLISGIAGGIPKVLELNEALHGKMEDAYPAELALTVEQLTKALLDAGLMNDDLLKKIMLGTIPVAEMEKMLATTGLTLDGTTGKVKAMGEATSHQASLVRDSTSAHDAFINMVQGTDKALGDERDAAVAAAREVRDTATAAKKAEDAHKAFLAMAQGTDKALRDEAAAAKEAKDATRQLEEATIAADDAYSALMDNLSDEEAWVTAQEAIDTYKWKMADGTSTQKEQEAALRTTIGALATYVEGLDGVAPEVKSNIYAALDSGNITLAQTMIAAIPKDVTSHITADTNKAAMHSVGLELDDLAKPRTVKLNPKLTPISGAFASGTDSAPPGIGLVGEEGPELVEFHGGERVHTAAKTRNMLGGGGGNTIIMNLPPGISAEAVIKAQRRAARRGLA